MSLPISNIPPLPYPSGADVRQLAAFDQDLTKALYTYLSDMARKINEALPKDGSEPMQGDLDMGGFDITNVGNITVSGTATVGGDTFLTGNVQVGGTGRTSILTLINNGNEVSGNPFPGRLLVLNNFAPAIYSLDRSTSAYASVTSTNGNVWRIFGGQAADFSDFVERFRVNLTNGDLTVTDNTDDTSTGPNINYVRTRPVPAANDFLSQWSIIGKDSAGNNTTYADIYGRIIDPVDGSEDGELNIRTITAGAQTVKIQLRGDGDVGLPVSNLRLGTDKAIIFAGTGAATTRTNLAVGSVRLSRAVVSSSVAAVDIALPAGYDSYELRINDLVIDTSGSNLFTRFSYDGGSTYRSTAGDYRQTAGYATTGNVWTAFTDVSGSAITIADSVPSSALGTNVYADIYAGGASRRTSVNARGTHQSSAWGASVQVHGGVATANGLATHIRLALTSGNITAGTFTLIGYN